MQLARSTSEQSLEVSSELVVTEHDHPLGETIHNSALSYTSRLGFGGVP